MTKESLTEKQINEITNTIENNSPKEEIKSMENAKESAAIDHTDIEETGTVSINTTSGNPDTVIAVPSLNINDTLTIDEINDNKLEESNEEKFNNSIVNFAKTADENISDQDALAILNVINMYKNKESSTKIYNAMPDSFKRLVDNMYLNTGGKLSKSKVIGFILDNFIAEANIEKEFVDFQKTMEQTLDIPSIMDMYSDHIKDVMEVKTLESADRLELAGETKKAELLRKISKSFTDTYTFESLKYHLHNDRKARNHITKDVKNYNKFCRDFNIKNESSKFAINDVSLLFNSLSRILTDVDSDDIKKFIILFCKRCDNMNSNDVIDCAYMYYFIKNIITLDYIDEAKTSFSTILITNIRDMISEILNVEEDHKKIVGSLRKRK